MGGTTEGGRKAAQTNKERFGEDFYKKIALKAQDKWVENGKKPRGFAYDRELAARVGKIGGHISRRGKSENRTTA